MATLRLAIEAIRAKEGAAQFDSALKLVETSSRRAVGGTKNLGTEIDRTGRTAARTAAALNGTSTAAETAGQRAQRATNGFRRFRRELSDTNETASRLVGTVARVGASFAGIAATRGVIGVISQFELTMATVGGVTRATADDFALLTDRAREMGATTRFSANEAAEGLLFLARAGFSTQESIDALPDTLVLAQAGALELGQAADYASNILRQFNLEAAETGRIVDTLVAVSNRSNTNVQQLAEAMKFAGPVAGSLGYQVEETAAAIGTLGDAGIQASLAGTNLRGIIAALLGPTTEGQKALERYGITLEEVNPAANSLIDIFTRFRDAGLGATEAVALFGRRNVSAATILTNNVDKLQQLADATALARGEAEELAERMNNTLFGSFKNLVSIVQELVLQLGDAGLKGVLKGAVDGVTAYLRVLGGVEEKGQEVAFVWRFMARVLQALIIATGTWIALDIAKALLNAALAARKAALGLAGLNSVLKANPWVLVASAIAGVVAATLHATAAMDDNKRKIEELEERYRRFSDAFTTLSRARALFEERQGNTGLTKQIESLDLYLRKLKEVREEFRVANREYANNNDQGILLRDIQSGASVPESLPTAEKLREVTGIDLREVIRGLRVERDELVSERERLKKELEQFTEIIPRQPDFPGGVPFETRIIPGAEEEVRNLQSSLSVASDRIGEVEASLRALDEGSGRIAAPLLEDILGGLIRRLESQKIELQVTLAENPELDDAAKRRAATVAAEAQRQFDLVLQKQRESNRILSLPAREQQEINDRIEAENLLRDEGLSVTEKRVSLIMQEIDQQRKLNQEATAKEFLQSYEDRAEALRRAGGDASRMQVELEKLNAVRKIEAEFTALSAEELKKLSDQVTRYIELLNQQRNAEKRKSQSEELLDELKLRAELIGKSQEEVDKALFLSDARRQAIQDEVADVDGYIRQIETLYDLLTDEQKAREIQDRWAQVGSSIGQSIGDALFSIVTESERASDALRRLFEQISRAAFDAAVTQPLQNLFQELFRTIFSAISGASSGGGAPGGGGIFQAIFSALGSAAGGAGGGATPGTAGTPAVGITPRASGGVFLGGITPYASGGVFDRPTRFRAGVQHGLLGEGSTGREGLFKLERMSDNTLGVRGKIDGESSRPNINMTIVTQDANSFRKSQRQIFAEARRRMA